MPALLLPDAPAAPMAPATMLTVAVPLLPPPPVSAGAVVNTMFELPAVCEATVLAPRLVPRNRADAPVVRASDANVTCVLRAASGVNVTVE